MCGKDSHRRNDLGDRAIHPPGGLRRRSHSADCVPSNRCRGADERRRRTVPDRRSAGKPSRSRSHGLGSRPSRARRHWSVERRARRTRPRRLVDDAGVAWGASATRQRRLQRHRGGCPTRQPARSSRGARTLGLGRRRSRGQRAHSPRLRALGRRVCDEAHRGFCLRHLGQPEPVVVLRARPRRREAVLLLPVALGVPVRLRDQGPAHQPDRAVPPQSLAGGGLSGGALRRSGHHVLSGYLPAPGGPHADGDPRRHAASSLLVAGFDAGDRAGVRRSLRGSVSRVLRRGGALPAAQQPPGGMSAERRPGLFIHRGHGSAAPRWVQRPPRYVHGHLPEPVADRPEKDRRARLRRRGRGAGRPRSPLRSR